MCIIFLFIQNFLINLLNNNILWFTFGSHTAATTSSHADSRTGSAFQSASDYEKKFVKPILSIKTDIKAPKAFCPKKYSFC